LIRGAVVLQDAGAVIKHAKEAPKHLHQTHKSTGDTLDTKGCTYKGCTYKHSDNVQCLVP
jgi:hypothetical protein